MTDRAVPRDWRVLVVDLFGILVDWDRLRRYRELLCVSIAVDLLPWSQIQRGGDQYDDEKQ